MKNKTYITIKENGELYPRAVLLPYDEYGLSEAEEELKRFEDGSKIVVVEIVEIKDINN